MAVQSHGDRQGVKLLRNATPYQEPSSWAQIVANYFIDSMESKY